MDRYYSRRDCYLDRKRFAAERMGLDGNESLEGEVLSWHGRQTRRCDLDQNR